MLSKQIETNFIVFTGGPFSGKTSILELIEKQGYIVSYEVARIFIENQIALGLTKEEIRKDEGKFQDELIETKLKVEAGLPKDRLVFLDRAMPDSITYYKVAKLNPKKIIDQCQVYRYKKVFIFDLLPQELFLQNIEQDLCRRENIELRSFIDLELEKDYISLGYQPIRVPVMDIPKRLTFIIESLD